MVVTQLLESTSVQIIIYLSAFLGRMICGAGKQCRLYKGLGLMSQEGQITSVDNIDQNLKEKAIQLIEFQGL